MRWRRFRFVLDFLINESLCGGKGGCLSRTPFDPKANELVRLELLPDVTTRPL